MAEDRIIEKHYCYDRPSGSNDALAYAAMANAKQDSSSDLLTMSLLGGGGMGGFNNPFAYLIWMMFANRFMGDGWGGGPQSTQNIEMQNQLQAIRSQLQDNQNSNLLMDAVKGNASAIQALSSQLNCDFNSLKDCCCDVKAGIDKVAGQVNFSAERVINAVATGNMNIVTAVKDCCCETQKELLKMQGDIQLQNCQQTNTIVNAINRVEVGQERGFSAVAFEAEKNKCELINAGNANTQRIIDTLTRHWGDEQAREIQDLKSELSNFKQTQNLIKMLQNGNNGCGCGCGC